VDDQFVGEYIMLNKENPSRVDLSYGDFKLKIVDDYIDLSGDFPFIHENRIKKTDAAVGFHHGTSFFYRPSLKSSILLTDSEFYDECRKRCEIVAIGPPFKTADGINIWYQVKTGDKTGWVFGGLSLNN
jgi:hypothetical protein